MNYIPLLLTFSSLFNLAQQTITECQPPTENQYLVLVRTATPESQTQLKRTLSSTPLDHVLCQYQQETVTRVGAFSSLGDAQKWADYFNETVKLSAVVATSPNHEAIKKDYPPFQPQALGSGYAVLVDYFNKPEMAQQVRQLLGKDVGLAAYVSRPYLLAIHTTNEEQAKAILKKLSDRGFWAIAVDSRAVTMLTPKVQY